MYTKGFYRGKTEEEIKKDIQKEGFNPVIISNDPGFIYLLHQHPETKLLAFLEGDMEVTVDSETFHCSSTDKVIIPGNTKHSAIVGKNGCIFLWSEKLV